MAWFSARGLLNKQCFASYPLPFTVWKEQKDVFSAFWTFQSPDLAGLTNSFIGHAIVLALLSLFSIFLILKYLSLWCLVYPVKQKPVDVHTYFNQLLWLHNNYCVFTVITTNCPFVNTFLSVPVSPSLEMTMQSLFQDQE